MKRFLVGLLAAVCLAAAPVVAGDTCTGPDGNHAEHVHAVPTGDHISHVADDGSYRDNDKGVWVDACGKEHPLCPAPVECPPEQECPEPTIVEMIECSAPEVTQVDVTINITEVNELPRFLQGWSVQAVIGQNDFRGIQARKNWFGMRAGRFDMSEFPKVQSFGSDPITDSDDGDAVDDFLNGHGNKQPVCHKGRTIYPATPGALNGHLNHGDTLGPCEDDEGPDDQGDPDDPEIDDEGWKITDDDAESLEAFVYIDSFLKREDRCFNEDGEVKAICRLGLYVGGGAIRYEEERVLNIDGNLRSVDDRYKFKLTGTAGVDYTFPFRLTVGAGYHTEAGVLVHAGYGIVW
jgi:hypothetical protein